MTSVERTFTVTPPPAVVIPYLADFGNATDWDPGTERCERNDAGPVAVGANWHNVSKIMGVSTELTYTLEKLTDDTVVLVGKNDSATSVDTITVRPHETGSEITYHVDLEMKGAAKIGTPVMKLVFEKLGGDTEDQMTQALNRLG
ncbi:Carbon monoxide dehydrogenase subunit G [Jatrophihabitans endophyticus]|uniref:Carbon monoxide dehydrogenase subunit G n=1 Tax=Jatrophihabitans endophyticus TaxID=1206085 RepID=A0A1M5KWC7_9ACTN|nr:SRPBCC family protein [Jatrophihabitans endophyticus]SHG57071.1 Carbon monoxide dehydrogenase subunit G [Jatrophihabitans endophyticus]